MIFPKSKYYFCSLMEAATSIGKVDHWDLLFLILLTLVAILILLGCALCIGKPKKISLILKKAKKIIKSINLFLK